MVAPAKRDVPKRVSLEARDMMERRELGSWEVGKLGSKYVYFLLLKHRQFTQNSPGQEGPLVQSQPPLPIPVRARRRDGAAPCPIGRIALILPVSTAHISANRQAMTNVSPCFSRPWRRRVPGSGEGSRLPGKWDSPELPCCWLTPARAPPTVVATAGSNCERRQRPPRESTLSPPHLQLVD